MLTEVFAANRAVDLFAFIDCCEKRTLHYTRVALDNIAGPIGRLNVEVWRAALWYAHASWFPVQKEAQLLIHRSKRVQRAGSPILVCLGSMHIFSLRETLHLQTPELGFVDSAHEWQLRTMVCEFIVARWAKEWANEKLKEAIEQRMQAAGQVPDLERVLNSIRYEQEPQLMHLL